MQNLKFCRQLRFLAAVWLLMPGAAGFAQKLQSAPAHDPAVHWLSAMTAQQEVQNKLEVMQPQLQSQIPGTAPYTDLLRRIIFYKSILRALLSGMPVEQAPDAALPDAASLGGLYEQAFTPETTLRLLYDEAVILLTDL
ncbi:MAG: hypothetical protein R3D58_02215 [Saprospiraceae bacterium]|nr:hypothetical protein [Lewinellaceae bacterium]